MSADTASAGARRLAIGLAGTARAPSQLLQQRSPRPSANQPNEKGPSRSRSSFTAAGYGLALEGISAADVARRMAEAG